MATPPTRPGKDQIDEKMKRMLDDHAAVAEKDKEHIPIRQLVQEGLAKLKHPAPT